ncbi:MAG TPA: hypothetical protein PKV56_01125 [Burkholderiaceae bacterium]|nr:hypothetical protein [Burkholderiaceae bacterium]
MAAVWLQALKVIPWGTVIDAAPGLAKSARGFFKRTQDAARTAADGATAPSSEAEAGDPLAAAHRRIGALESSLAQATERQQAAAELLDALAAQNAQLVEAIDAVRRRVQILVFAVAVLAVGCAGALIWVASIAS